MPPSPLGGEGFTGTFYRLPPSGGKLASEARLMRGGKVDPRADEDIRPYNTDNIRSPHPVGAGVLTGPRTGDISPPGEVLSRDGKYPKIPGSADPDPGRTFGKRPEYVRRGHELGAIAFSARCRSCRSNQVTPLFSHRASRVPCLFDSVRGGPVRTSAPTVCRQRMIPSVGAGVLTGPQAAAGRPRGS